MIKPCRRCEQPTNCIGGQKYCPVCKPIVAAAGQKAEAARQRARLAAVRRACCACRVSMPIGRTHRYCGDCMADYNSGYYAANEPKLRERAREYTASNQESRRAYKTSPEQRAKAKARAHRAYHRDLDLSRARSRANQGKRSAIERKGTATASDYRSVLTEAAGICAMCRLPVASGKLHVDHIIPLSRGGKHEASNLQALCQPCNQRKYNKLPSELSSPP